MRSLGNRNSKASKKVRWNRQAHGPTEFRKFHLSLALLAFLFVVVVPAGRSTSHQEAVGQKSSLRVLLSDEARAFWKVRITQLQDSVRGTFGHLRVENISEAKIDDAVFYAEYFDAKGRFCFALAFSVAKNIGARSPIAPGETRDLYASVGLTPALEPQELRLYLLRHRSARPEDSARAWDVPVRVPVTGGASLPAGADFLQLHSELESLKGPVLDLVLVELTVDEHGRIDSVEPLQAVSLAVRSGFENFVRQLRFWPATDAGRARNDRLLVLARAVTSKDTVETRVAIDDPAYAPRNLPWVAAYTQALQHQTVPPVMQLVFSRPPARIKESGRTEWTKLPPAPPSHFQLWLVADDWDPPGLQSVIDPSLPGKLRRVVAP